MISEVTTQGKISHRYIQSAKNFIIRDSVDESTQNGLKLNSCPPESSTDAIDKSDNERESQLSPSKSDAKDLTHQYQCVVERDFHDFKEFIWGGGDWHL